MSQCFRLRLSVVCNDPSETVNNGAEKDVYVLNLLKPSLSVEGFEQTTVYMPQTTIKVEVKMKAQNGLLLICLISMGPGIAGITFLNSNKFYSIQLYTVDEHTQEKKRFISKVGKASIICNKRHKMACSHTKVLSVLSKLRASMSFQSPHSSQFRRHQAARLSI